MTILVVSHSMDFIQKSCDKSIWLKNGHIQLEGESGDVVKSYLDSVA